MEQETEPFTQDKQLRDVYVSSAKSPGEPTVAKLYMSPYSDTDAIKKSSHDKCWLWKKFVKFICQVVAVCAIVFIAHTIINRQNKTGTDNTSIHGGTETNASRPQALRGIYLLSTKTTDVNKTKEDSNTVSDDDHAKQTDNYDHVTLKPQQIGQKIIPDGKPADYATNHDGFRKHYLNIGMREDKMMQDCHGMHMKHSFPDIDYAFLGYDVFRGYPLADGHDPGFTFPIFDADYSHGKQTADCRYSVPKGFLVVPDVSCVTSFSSEVIQTVKELDYGLSVNADVRGRGLSMAFSASAGYRQASSELSTGDYTYILSTAHCYYYYSKLQLENPPPFTQSFIDWVHKLNNSSNNDTYFDFFSTFGTHFAKEITFGARFSYENKMNSTLYRRKHENNVNLAAQASYNGLFSLGGGFSLTSEQRKEASEFSKSIETRTVSVGAAPPVNGDAMKWASVVQDNPVPSKYKLELIETLFHEQFMGDLGVDYETISIKLKELQTEYYKRIMPEEWKDNIQYLSNGRVTKTLFVNNGGKYGSWLAAEFCPVGTLAVGFNLKYQDIKDSVHDNTALNAISLQCADKDGNRAKGHKLVQSGAGHRGDWKGDVLCPKPNGAPLFLQRFVLKAQQESTTEDNTAANIIQFNCRDLHQKQQPRQLLRTIAGTKGHYGLWSEKCPPGSAICGIQTRIEGHTIKGDNTALNDVKFFCCG